MLNAERGGPINTVVLDVLKADAKLLQAVIYDYLARLSQDSAPYLLVPDLLDVEDVRINIYYPEFTDLAGQ